MNHLDHQIAQTLAAFRPDAVNGKTVQPTSDSRYVKRQDGTVIRESEYRLELHAGILDVLQRYGPQKIVDIRVLMSTGFFLSDVPRGQWAEISGALKGLKQAGAVIQEGHIPYHWRKA